MKTDRLQITIKMLMVSPCVEKRTEQKEYPSTGPAVSNVERLSAG